MSMSHNITFIRDEPWALETLNLVAGTSVTITCTYRGASSVSASGATATAYYKKGGTDITSTVFPSGTITASGNALTLKPLTALVQGNEYRIVVSAVVDSADTVVKMIQVKCRGAKNKTVV